ncbi:MAG: hypothetical protein WBA97_12330 [Actinophytocola sp.]|uniref:hypothetical protein n=1 Tax=Actinophytocola sp. TaxID=1872138 RepID=UPI003C729557
MTVDLDDFEDAEDLAALLGLPEQLPALHVPPLDELAVTARESALLRRVGALATWVGERREVTEDGDLTGPDTAEAAERLGVGQAELLLCWEVALATDLVVVSEDGEADANPDLWSTGDDQEDLGTWTAAFTQVLPSLEIDAELAGEEDLDFGALGSLVLPMFLIRTLGVPVAELREMAREIATEHLEDDVAWDGWVAAHGDPAAVLLARLAEHGAVEVEEDVARLTPLGLLAMREELVEGGIDIPLLPPLADMTATDLLSAVGGLTDDELTELTDAWLGRAQADERAAAELLAAAAQAHPEARLHATTVLGDVPGTPWESVLDDEALRAYALVALDRELAPADVAWLVVDLVAATADQLGAYDATAVPELFGAVVPEGLGEEVLAVAWRLPHPETFEVLTLIGNHHPDKQVAKAARTAAHKARSAG